MSLYRISVVLFGDMSGYKGGRMSARPFVVTLEELMKG
jgi:hypothetical protein